MIINRAKHLIIVVIDVINKLFRRGIYNGTILLYLSLFRREKMNSKLNGISLRDFKTNKRRTTSLNNKRIFNDQTKA